MEVKPGYKQSEVGVIPEDWVVRPASEISSPVRGGSPRPAGDPKYFNGSFIPWLTVAALTNIPDSNLIVSETASYLTEEGSLRSRTLFPGTLIIANSGATLGVAKLLGIKCCANDGIAALLNMSKDVSPRYLVYYINTKTTFLRNIVASGNGQPNLNTALIGNFKLPLPPTKAEQEAIARALSDADAWIESLEQLIAKKRQIKQGAMQELLTGKRRLPGFSGKWETKRFGEITSLRNERVDPRRYGPFDFCIELEHIEQATGRLIGSASTTSTSSLKSVFKSRDVLFGKLRAYLRKYWITNSDGVCSTEIWVFTPRTEQLTPEYLFQIITVDSFIDVASTAYGTHMPRSDWNVVKNYVLTLPCPVEQTAIATILSDMDTEIKLLESKLAKAQEIKQGMMQELLTGRIRLV
jgi:type I restriction enzyme S subunit